MKLCIYLFSKCAWINILSWKQVLFATLQMKAHQNMSATKSSQETSVTPDGGWGWIIVFVSFVLHMTGKMKNCYSLFYTWITIISARGIVYSFGIFLNEFMEEFGTSYGSTSLISSVQMGVLLCVGPIAANLVKKFGCRSITIVGLVVAATGLITGALAQSVVVLYVTSGFCTGTVCFAQWFKLWPVTFNYAILIWTIR